MNKLQSTGNKMLLVLRRICERFNQPKINVHLSKISKADTA